MPKIYNGHKVRVNLSFEVDVLKEIDEVAKQRGLSRSAFLCLAAKESIHGREKVVSASSLMGVFMGTKKPVTDES